MRPGKTNEVMQHLKEIFQSTRPRSKKPCDEERDRPERQRKAKYENAPIWLSSGGLEGTDQPPGEPDQIEDGTTEH